MAEILDHSDNFKAFAAPPYSSGGVGYCQFTLFTGATIVLPTEVFNPEYIMKTIQEEKIAAIILVRS